MKYTGMPWGVWTLLALLLRKQLPVGDKKKMTGTDVFYDSDNS